MFPSSSWMGGFPMTNNSSDDIQYYKYSNFEIFFGPGSKISAPLVKKKQTTVLIKNLPREVTKEMIQELLVSKPVKIKLSSLESVDLFVLDGKACCKVKFDLDLNASLVNTIHTWYMRINGIQDESHESNILVEYPVPVHPECNEASIQQLKEDLSNDDTFKDGLGTLEHWLQQGEVNKRNADGFISSLYLIYKKVNALNNEKMASDSKLQDAKKDLRSKVEGLSLSLKDFKNVLRNASQKKVWDHFTKAQRKNLDVWKEEVDKLEQEYSQELLREREEDEMEICDGERESVEIPDANTISSLKEQLDTLRNRKATLKTEMTEYRRKVDEELNRNKDDFHETLREITELTEKTQELKKNIANANLRIEELDNPIIPVSEPSTSSETPSEPPLRLSGQDILLLGDLASFLNLHVNGANIEYLTSFLKDSGKKVTPEDVEELMKRFPNMFAEETIGIGADLRKVWKYVWPVLCPAAQST